MRKEERKLISRATECVCVCRSRHQGQGNRRHKGSLRILRRDLARLRTTCPAALAPPTGDLEIKSTSQPCFPFFTCSASHGHPRLETLGSSGVARPPSLRASICLLPSASAEK